MLTIKKTNRDMGRAAILMALILVVGGICAAAQSAPPIVLSSTATVATSGTSKVDKVVQDTCGNLYELENGGNLLEIPAGGGAAIYLASYGGSSADGLSGGIAIDSKNNLYVDQKWSGAVQEIPSSGCVPNPSAATSVASSSLGAVGNYWYDPGDIYVDAAGDIFVASNNCCNSNEIFEQTAAGKGVLVLGGNGLPQVESLVTDSSGDLFFTVNGSGTVYEIPVASYGTSSPQAVITSAIGNALGLAFDAAGNLYVGDSSTGSIYEVPYTSSLQFAKMYLLAAGAPIGAPLTISHDNKSFFFGNNNANVYQLALGSINLGGVAVGSSASGAFGVAFNAAVTPSAFTLFPSGGQYSITGGSNPCSGGTAYTAGQSCNATITFNPATPGTAVAGAVVAGATGAPLATLYVSGVGQGAGLTLDPGTVAATGSGFKSPDSVAIDAAGNVFYADAGNNAILEFKSGSSTAVSIGTGLSKPAGVAVDGAGNVFIVDTGNNRIVEVPMVNGALSNSAQVALPGTMAGAALKAPAGLAVDSAGDLFIADTGNNRIVGVPYTEALNTSAATALGSSLSGPLAVAADASGNVYVANSGAGQIYKILSPFAQPTQALVAVGFGNPTGLTVDASGSLFVADYVNGDVVRIPNISGSLNPNAEVEAAIGIGAPYGVALDAYGNLYVSDTSGAAAYKVTRTSTTLAFGDWALSASSGVLAATVEDEGNQSLTLGTPYYTAAGNTGDFNVSTTASGICAAGGTVTTGASCELDATFAPTASGTRTDTLTLSSNASNAASTQVTLTGNGATTAATATKLTMTSPASGSPFFGQPITLSVSVTAASGTPAGSVILVVDGAQVGDATLNSSGAATFNLASGLTGGSHTLVAVYNGSATFDGSVSSSLQFTVTKAPTVTTLTVVTPYTSPQSAVSGASISMTAVISSTGVGIPTGTVTFTSNGKTVGTAPVQPASGGIFEASLSTTALAVGSDLIVATYPGDPNYIGSGSTSTTVAVVSAPLVTVSAGGASISSNANSNGTVTFTATSYGGWTGAVGFGCVANSLPTNARCVFSPGQITVVPSTPTTPSSNPTVSLSVAIDQPPQTPTASKLVWWIAGPVGLLLLFARRRVMRRGWATISTVIALVLLGITASGLTACTSGTKYITPTGSSTVTVVVSSDPFISATSTTTQACPANNPASAPCAQQTFNVSLTVQ